MGLLLFFQANVHIYVKTFCFREGVGNANYGDVELLKVEGIIEVGILGKVIFSSVFPGLPSFLSLHLYWEITKGKNINPPGEITKRKKYYSLRENH